MSLLVESIKVADRKLWNIKYHNERFNNARRELFKCADEIDLGNEIELPDLLSTGLYKCRVIYNENIVSVEFLPYKRRALNTLKIVKDDSIDYRFKYADRSMFKALLQNSSADDILIIKNGLVTDTSFSNVILSDGSNLLTPSTPLLKGTKRAKLLDDGIISEEIIYAGDLNKFDRLYIINCMIDLEEQEGIAINNLLY